MVVIDNNNILYFEICLKHHKKNKIQLCAREWICYFVGIIAYGVLTALFIYLRYILGVNKRDEIILNGDVQFLTIYLFLCALCFTCVYACVRVLLQTIVSHHVGAEH